MRIRDWSSDVCSSDLIKAEAERLGYVPNVHARSLVLGSRKTIGVIVSNISNPFFSDLVSEVELQAQHAGYTVLLLLSYESAERERDAIDRALRSGLDGVIAAPVPERSTAWTPVIQAGIPLVLVSSEEHPSDLQSLMRISYAAFCLKKK